MKKGWQIFWHTLFWVAMISFFMVIGHGASKNEGARGLVVIFVLFGVVNISLFYVNYLYLIPRYLNRKQYFNYNLAVLLVMLAYGFIKYGFACVFPDIILMHGKTDVTGFWSYYLGAFITSMVFVFLSTVLKFTLDWFLNERIQRNLETQRLSAELAFLKSQINPHFLFNSLNSIYSLAYQKSDATPDAILKLSEIMRYMLYECNDNKVELSKELQYLQNYIDLQKIRFGDKAQVDFEITGQVADQKIVPLMLISFIENAFKHGIANDSDSPIIIRILVKPAHIFFKIENKKHQYNKDSAGGIGLINVKRRLDLLYPGNYSLDIVDGADSYVCELSLNL